MLFAVIDDAKEVDKPNDNHSSKAIVVGISAPRGVQVKKTGDRFLVAIEAGKDIDPTTLRFGAPSQVDFGRTSPALSMTANGTNLVAEFSASTCGFQPSDRTAKFLAWSRKGDLVFGYAPMPGEPTEYPLLSVDGSVKPQAVKGDTRELVVRIENFGLAKSAPTKINLRFPGDASGPFTAPLPQLEPYAGADVRFIIPAKQVPPGSKPKVEIGIEGEPSEDDLTIALPKLP